MPVFEQRRQIFNNIIIGIKDSDWVGDSNHRKLITGIVIMLAGACWNMSNFTTKHI